MEAVEVVKYRTGGNSRKERRVRTRVQVARGRYGGEVADVCLRVAATRIRQRG